MTHPMTPTPTPPGWQPIETAPRDGTRVLLWLKDEGCALIGMWTSDPCDGEFMWWLPEWDERQTDDGMHWITHWHILPPPPPETAP